MSKSENTSLMSSQSDYFEDVDIGVEPGAEETRTNIEIIGQVNDELGELTRVLNTRRTGNSTPTFKSLNAELDVFRTNLNEWLNDATARVDDEMVDTYAGWIEKYIDCPRVVATVGSIILTCATEKYESIFESIFEEKQNKPLPPMNLELKNNKSKIVQLLDMVGTGLETARISDIKSAPSNLWGAIKDLTLKTTQYVSTNSGKKCSDISALKLVEELNSDTEGYFTDNANYFSAKEQSSEDDKEPDFERDYDSRKIPIAAAASAALYDRDYGYGSKAATASADLYNTDDTDDGYKGDESYLSDEEYGGGFKKTRKRSRPSLRKCKNKSTKKCLRKGKSKTKGKKYKNKSTKKRFHRKK